MPEWAALFTLGGGVCDVHSLRIISGVTPAELLMASMADCHCSPPACFSRGRILDSNGRQAWQCNALTTRPPATSLKPV